MVGSVPTQHDRGDDDTRAWVTEAVAAVESDANRSADTHLLRRRRVHGGDRGERYQDTYYSDEWVRTAGLDLSPHLATVQRFIATGRWVTAA
jgi:hypothetical protein